MKLSELIAEIEALRRIMIDTAGGPAFSLFLLEGDYRKHRSSIYEELASRGFDDPNPFPDLLAWKNKCEKSLQSYEARITFVCEMYDPLIEAVRKYRPFTDYKVALENIEELEKLDLDDDLYFSDRGYWEYVDEAYFPRIQQLREHIEKLGLRELYGYFEQMRCEPGSFTKSLRILKAHAIPATKTRLNELISNVPPAEPQKPDKDDVIPHSLVTKTRGYIEKVTFQINGCYAQGWYDGCAVMIRRLLETLIIEVFEAKNMADKIKKQNGDYFFLGDLISVTLSETTIGRNSRAALPRLKGIGDQSAHSRRFIAQRTDIEKIIPDLRTVVQELLFLAELK